MTTEIKNKSEYVRNVLKNIGALTDTPPVDWKKQVETALAAQNLTMHEVMIYQIRKKERDKLSGVVSPARRGRKPGKTVAKTETVVKTPKAKPVSSSLCVEDLLKARKVANEFGGIDKLQEALSALKSLS